MTLIHQYDLVFQNHVFGRNRLRKQIDWFVINKIRDVIFNCYVGSYSMIYLYHLFVLISISILADIIRPSLNIQSFKQDQARSKNVDATYD